MSQHRLNVEVLQVPNIYKLKLVKQIQNKYFG